jgi:hypothetical protein
LAEPRFFEKEADFRCWLKANHETAPELIVGFWKKGTGKPSIDWPQARDQALCFGWIDGHRKSLGDDAYMIRFTPRRKGSIWSKINVDRFKALKAAGLMTPAGERVYEENKHKTAVYAYENAQRELTAEEERLFPRERRRVGGLGEAAAELSQVGAVLDHRRKETGNARQAPPRARRGQRGGTAAAAI